MPEFFQTKMGQQFYDSTMPRIARALESIATSLAKAPGVLVEPVKTEHVPLRARKEPYVGKVMELSTAHIPQETAGLMSEMAADDESIRLLSVDGGDLYISIVDRCSYGWFLSVPDGKLGDNTPLPAADSVLLSPVVYLVKYAQEHHCNWLLLDADADKVENLPTYEW